MQYLLQDAGLSLSPRNTLSQSHKRKAVHLQTLPTRILNQGMFAFSFHCIRFLPQFGAHFDHFKILEISEEEEKRNSSIALCHQVRCIPRLNAQ